MWSELQDVVFVCGETQKTPTNQNFQQRYLSIYWKVNGDSYFPLLSRKASIEPRLQMQDILRPAKIKIQVKIQHCSEQVDPPCE